MQNVATLRNDFYCSSAIGTAYAFFGSRKGEVHVFLLENAGDNACKPLYILEGHAFPVELLAVDHDSSTKLLCSADRNVVLLWEMLRIFKSGSRSYNGTSIGDPLLDNQNPIEFFKVLHRSGADAQIYCLKFSPDGGIVAIGEGNNIYVYCSRSGNLLFLLNGHDGPVSSITFHANDLLVSCSHDRTFIVWNLSEGRMSFRSFILSSAPCTEICAHIGEHEIRMGVLFSNALMKVFDVEVDGDFCREILAKYMEFSDDREIDELSEEMSQTCTVISAKRSLMSVPDAPAPSQQPDRVNLQCIPLKIFTLSNGWSLLVTTSCLCKLSLSNLETTLICWFPTTVQTVDVSSWDGTVQIACTNGVTGTGHIYTIPLDEISTDELPSHVDNKPQDLFSIPVDSCRFSILKEAHLPERLLKPLCPKTQDATPVKGAGPRHRFASSNYGSRGSNMNMPVTFHRKIQSSGYGKSKQSPSLQRKKGPSRKPTPVAIYDERVSPVDMDVISRIPHSEPVLDMCVHHTGKYIAYCGGNGLAVVRRIDRSTGQVADSSPNWFNGLKGTVTSCCMAHSKPLALFTSSSGASNMYQYDIPSKDPRVVLDSSFQSRSSSKEVAECFAGGIQASSFFHMDQLLCLASKHKLIVARYYVHDQPTNDLKRTLNLSCVKPSVVLAHPEKSIAHCLACSVGAYSPLCLAAYGDRSISLWDVASEQTVCDWTDAHDRSIHYLSFNHVSPFVESAPSGLCDTFLSCSTDGAVKLWDLRAERCVRVYRGCHRNNIHRIEAAVSPCGRFVGVGSEDKAPIVYDLKQGTLLGRMSPSLDTVTTVQFNPAASLMYSGGLDGGVYTYSGTRQSS